MPEHISDEKRVLEAISPLKDAIDRVSYITPVPKGVGLITKAMLLENTIEVYRGGI